MDSINSIRENQELRMTNVLSFRNKLAPAELQRETEGDVLNAVAGCVLVGISVPTVIIGVATLNPAMVVSGGLGIYKGATIVNNYVNKY